MSAIRPFCDFRDYRIRHNGIEIGQQFLYREEPINNIPGIMRVTRQLWTLGEIYASLFLHFQIHSIAGKLNWTAAPVVPSVFRVTIAESDRLLARAVNAHGQPFRVSGEPIGFGCCYRRRVMPYAIDYHYALRAIGHVLVKARQPARFHFYLPERKRQAIARNAIPLLGGGESLDHGVDDSSLGVREKRL